VVELREVLPKLLQSRLCQPCVVISQNISDAFVASSTLIQQVSVLYPSMGEAGSKKHIRHMGEQ
jgi:hypothetical protein